MAKSMKRRDVERRLRKNGCTVINDDGPHTTWQCGCDEKHLAFIPRHTVISPGVVRDTQQRIACRPEGWLQ